MLPARSFKKSVARTKSNIMFRGWGSSLLHRQSLNKILGWAFQVLSSSLSFPRTWAFPVAECLFHVLSQLPSPPQCSALGLDTCCLFRLPLYPRVSVFARCRQERGSGASGGGRRGVTSEDRLPQGPPSITTTVSPAGILLLGSYRLQHPRGVEIYPSWTLVDFFVCR
jgi:hypothetical protein